MILYHITSILHLFCITLSPRLGLVSCIILSENSMAQWIESLLMRSWVKCAQDIMDLKISLYSDVATS